jgi:hypothetical protein
LQLAAVQAQRRPVTTPVVETPVVDTPVVETPVVVAPNAIALAASSTTETVVGTIGDDAITGSAANYEDTDRIVDASGTDSDTLVIDEAAAINPDVTNIEDITLNLNALGTADVDASKITGTDILTINRGDVEVGGSTLTGGKTVVVTNADSAGVAKIVAGAGSTTLDIDSAAADKARSDCGCRCRDNYRYDRRRFDRKCCHRHWYSLSCSIQQHRCSGSCKSHSD